MRREPVPLPQLGFLLRLRLGHVVAQHPGAEADGLPAVPEAVDGERLLQPPGTGHRIDPRPGSGHEPEPPPHAASFSCTALRRRARYSRIASRSSALRSLRARLTSRRISNQIRLRFAGDSPRRTPKASDAALTTASRSTTSANSFVSSAGADSSVSSPSRVIT